MLDKAIMIKRITETILQQRPDFPAEKLAGILSRTDEADLQRLMKAMSRFELDNIFQLMGQLEYLEEQKNGN